LAYVDACRALARADAARLIPSRHLQGFLGAVRQRCDAVFKVGGFE